MSRNAISPKDIQPHEAAHPAPLRQTLAGDIDETPQTLLDHLNELRNRLFHSVLALVLCVVVSSAFTGPLLRYLITPYDNKLQVLGPTESVVIYFRVALLAGAIASSPYITFQLFMFVAPGLYRHEKRWIYLALPATTFFFLAGILFAWFILTPAALNFLRDFEGDVFRPEWTAELYIRFLTSLLFWIGVAFEMPVVIFVLARMGIVGYRTLLRNWRLAVILSSVAAAMITPTVDPFNMLLVMGPLMGLYTISIGLAALAYPRHLRRK